MIEVITEGWRMYTELMASMGPFVVTTILFLLTICSAAGAFYAVVGSIGLLIDRYEKRRSRKEKR